MAQKSMALIIQNEKDEVLLLDHVKLDGLALPGGKMDTGDIDLVGTCIREAKEELGIRLQHVKKIKTYEDYIFKDGVYDGMAFDLTVYLTTAYCDEIVNKEPEKHKDIIFMDIDEVVASDKSCRVTKMILNDFKKSERVKEIRRMDDLGRIVIPRKIREALGANYGDSMEITLNSEDNTLILKPILE